MTQVAPSPKPVKPFVSNILFNSLDFTESPNRCYILMYGLGSPGTISGTPKATSTGTYILLPYDTKGVFHDAMTVVRDVKKIDQTQRESPHRTKRLMYTIDQIKQVLASDRFHEVILIGLSHGSLILFSALTCIEADSSVPVNQLKKLRFFAVSPPTILPPNLLSYNVSKEQILPISIDDVQFDIKPVPPYIQLQYINDFFYDSTLGFAKKFVLSKITKYFNNFNKLHPLDEHGFWVKSNKHPTNKLFFFDENTNILMLGQLNGESPDYRLDDYRLDKRYTYGQANLTKKKHAQIAFMYPFTDAFYMSIIINKLMADFETADARVSQGGNSKLHIIGRARIIVTKGRWQYVRYKNELITIKKAKGIENKLRKKL